MALTKKNETRHLACVLTEDEKRFKTGELVRHLGDKNQAELKKKEVTADITAVIKKHEAEISKLTTQISNGVEYRDVQCDWYPIYKEKIKKLIRVDTKECIQVENMSDYERQGLLEDELGETEDELGETKAIGSETITGKDETAGAPIQGKTADTGNAPETGETVEAS